MAQQIIGTTRLAQRTSAAATNQNFAELYARPVLANNRVAVIGDSIASHNSLISGGNSRYLAHGYLAWAAYLSRQRFWFPADANSGIAGNNTTDVLGRIDAFLKTNDASVIVLDVLTNDEPNGVSYDTSVSNYNTIIKKIRDAGRIVVAITPRPRDITAVGLTLTANQAKTHLRRRDFVYRLHDASKGIYVIDTWNDLADRTSTNMAQVAGVSYDGLHQNQTGAYYDGMAIAKLFGLGREPGLFPFIDVLAMSAIDTYDATYNPRGALNTNPMMTGGTSNATGYAAINGQGVTSTLSKVNTGNKIWQQSVLSGTATGTSLIWPVAQNPIPSGNLTIGDVVTGFCDFEMDAGVTGISGLGLALSDNTSFARAMCFDTTTDINTSTMPTVAHTGVMRIPRFTLTSTGVRVGIAASAINAATVAATFRVGAMSFRKVT